ncbi:MAG: 4-alpha-glucanotransferase [Myxococcaceae bacterium]
MADIPLQDALKRLGIDHLSLVIHDPSFPSTPEEETGRGTPYGRGAEDFLRFARELGFNAIQLGPQGRTSAVNASPYDGSIFANSESSLAIARLGLPEETVQGLVASGAGAREVVRRAVDQLAVTPALREEVERNRRAWAYWLEPDALYLSGVAQFGTEDWRLWPAQPVRDERIAQREALAQTLLDVQHRALRERLHAQGMKLLGDLQIGISFADQWAYAPLFLRDFRMGAPPSRTNPDGQPWSYPVLDPALYEEGAKNFVRARVRRALSSFDGVRVDHPHGWVDPWVYRVRAPSPVVAVKEGARLFSSPKVPALAPYAIARAEQLNEDLPRHADNWVRELDEAQVARFGELLSVILEEAQGRLILVEVLSTWPYPLRRVMERAGLGRFLVTQKTDPNNPEDVYRTERARAGDWVMLGTHDTESIWSLVPRWMGTTYAVDRARHLAERLEPESAKRTAFAQHTASSPEAMIEALFAELFASQARGVSVFFADLLGMPERYNAPGTVGPHNWSLRVPRDFRHLYEEKLKRGAALNLSRAVTQALRAKGLT